MDFLRGDIERHLEMHILNLCIASVVGKEGDRAECKRNLIDAVEKIVRDTKGN
jgi:hypothetical protein